MKLLKIIFYSLLLPLSSLADESKDASDVMQRLIEKKWFGEMTNSNGFNITLKKGDVLYQGVFDILSKSLKNNTVKKTIFSGGDNSVRMVEIIQESKDNQVSIRFRNDIRNYEKKKILIARVGGLVSACYYHTTRQKTLNIKKLYKNSSISLSQASLMALQLDYDSILFTYNFYNNYGVKWSEANGIDPADWSGKLSFGEFIDSERGRRSKVTWEKWLKE